MSIMSKKPRAYWVTRVSGTVNQVGQHVRLEPHGDKTQLPRALQQIRPVGEIEEMIAKQRHKNMTPEELEEERLIELAVKEVEQEEDDEKRRKNLVDKLNAMLEKREKKQKMKDALEEAKEEVKLNEGTDGYEDRAERLAEIQEANDRRANYVFG
jgi:hypothetical protein